MNRKIYHVTPAGDDWRVRCAGARRAAPKSLQTEVDKLKALLSAFRNLHEKRN